VTIERYSSQPLVPLRIFKLRALSSANGIAVAVGALMFSLFFFLSLYMQDVLHFSALKTGFAFVPGAVAIIIGAQTASRLVSKVGPRRLIISGAVLAAIGEGWLYKLPAAGNYYTHVLPPLLLVSLGLGLCIVPVTVAATMGVDRREAGLASGLVNTTRQVGGALGLAVLATIASDRSKGARTAGALSAGFDRAFLVAGFIAVVGALLALTLPSRNAHVAAVEQSARDHTAPPQPAVAEH
jgi:predicted MFS family arabinose efflux permease